MANAPAQQSSSPEDASRIITEIERLKKLKDAYGWKVSHWDYASSLFDVWLSLDKGEPDIPNKASVHPLVDWLWDVIDTIQRSSQTEREKIQTECDNARNLSIDVDQWISDCTDLLKQGWQQYDRFSLRCDGDLATPAIDLLMQYEFVEENMWRSRWYELTLLSEELQHHIYPEGEPGICQELVLNRKIAKKLRKQGKHENAELFLLPKDQWEKPLNCSSEKWANIIKPFNRRNIDELVDEYLARVELARLGLIPNECTAIEALQKPQR